REHGACLQWPGDLLPDQVWRPKRRVGTQLEFDVSPRRLDSWRLLFRGPTSLLSQRSHAGAIPSISVSLTHATAPSKFPIRWRFQGNFQETFRFQCSKP